MLSLCPSLLHLFDGQLFDARDHLIIHFSASDQLTSRVALAFQSALLAFLNPFQTSFLNTQAFITPAKDIGRAVALAST
ncbi:hypothetical protein SAMN04487951_107253 [Vreelandella arcis]|uniref:Uncharacterized protein n=1 Tax=Vreelandella arcis TaxID=416873 RepID=A0A1H0DTT6_9GAMM|nr:hypothetical protein SAMN04487951_107253 [Halomonas arcis]